MRDNLADDLADVLAHMVVGWEPLIGHDLAQHPEVLRVMERYRLDKEMADKAELALVRKDNPTLPEQLRLTAIYCDYSDWRLDRIREAATLIEKIMDVVNRQPSVRVESKWADALHEIGMLIENDRHERWRTK